MTDAVRELIERLSEAVHRAYCENYLKRKGEPYWTGGDYSKLDEETKEIDRDTVRAVLAALEAAPEATKPEVCRWKPIGEFTWVGCETEWPVITAEPFTYCPDCGRKIEVAQ